MRHLRNSLDAAAEFLAVKQKCDSVEGFLHDLEGFALNQLAALGPGVGAIVELGSYQGRSTAFLALGSKSAGREKVFAVDHFRGSEEHQPGRPHESNVLATEGTTFNRFQENMRRLQLDDQVIPIVADSQAAARNWQEPIRLLFIDGDHSYEASKRDFELWSPFVVPKGMICFHDIPTWGGVTKFFEELISTSLGKYRQVGAVLSMRIVEKI